MTDLSVERGYLEELAAEQDEAAERLTAAAAAVDGTARKLLWDHGVICAASVGSMKAAEKQRKKACDNMANVSTDLAEKLRLSAQAYGDTDAQAGESLDRQVVSE